MKLATRISYSRQQARRLMTNMLGRELVSGELVHHLDHNPLNNSADNLSVMSGRSHLYIHREPKRRARIARDAAQTEFVRYHADRLIEADMKRDFRLAKIAEKSWTPERIRALRRRLGDWSIDDLARHLYVSRMTVYRWEKPLNRSRPSSLAALELNRLDGIGRQNGAEI